MLGNRQVMGQNIDYYMNRMGLERKELAKALGVPYSSLTDWMNGNSYPRIDKIQKMADFFGVEKSDLVEPRSAMKSVKATKIPILGQVAAGPAIEMIENIEGDIILDSKLSEDCFALRIKGDSMSPRMESGDIVVVKKQPDIESGDLAIVAVDGEMATCKRVKKYRDGIELIPINPSYPTRFFTHEEIQSLPVTIIGKVVELRAKF
ncbi:MAG: helix-turn-helix domain-containing protein [Clostridiales bacterium]|nr:helix-turn-helix domain-containing protein [Clostridiales bacterium]